MGFQMQQWNRVLHAGHTEWLSACCRYFDFVNFNTTGYRPYVTTLYAVLLGCLRKSISRILVLIVSMGFGVVLPYLGAIQHKVTAMLQSCVGIARDHGGPRRSPWSSFSSDISWPTGVGESCTPSLYCG